MIETKWDLEQGLVFFEGVDSVSLNDIRAALMEAMSTEHYLQTHASVWDLTNAKIEISQMDIHEVIPSIQAVAATAPEGRKLAWVVEFELHSVIADLIYANYEWTTQWQVFKSVDEAIEWCMD